MTHLSMPALRCEVDPKALARFSKKIHVSPAGCWVWTGATSNGYANMWVDGKTRYAHRLSHEWFIGFIPDGMEVDHLCRVRACVNPEHLEVVTPAVNTQRQPQRAVQRCPSGHPYSGDNLYAHGGRRYCRTCSKVHLARFRAKVTTRTAVSKGSDDERPRLLHPASARLPMNDGCPSCLARDQRPHHVQHLRSGYYATYSCASCHHEWWTGWSTEPSEVDA